MAYQIIVHILAAVGLGWLIWVVLLWAADRVVLASDDPDLEDEPWH